MERAGTEPTQGVHVLFRPVTLMFGKPVFRVLAVVFQADPVPRHFGEDARRRDRDREGVARDPRLVRDRDPRPKFRKVRLRVYEGQFKMDRAVKEV